MAGTPIGRILLMPQGSYSGTTTYNMLDYVRDNGATWVCKVDGTVGIAPPTLPTTSNANWQLLAADGSVTGAVDWTSGVNNKPFETIGTGLTVDSSFNLNLDTSYLTGSRISYDHTSSGLTASDVQSAIDEIANSGGASTLAGLTDVTLTTPSDGQMLVYDNTTTPATPFWKNVNQPTIPTVNDSTITIQKNGTSVDSFTTNASAAKNINIPMDEWFGTTATVSSGSVTFTGIDDSSGTRGYKPWVVITSASTNKNPTAELSTMSGEGTSNMSLTYTTDADNGATVYLRITK